MAYVAWFKDLTKGDIALAGGKGANLGEMARSDLPVPPGFVVTSQAYQHFLSENKTTARELTMLTARLNAWVPSIPSTRRPSKFLR